MFSLVSGKAQETYASVAMMLVPLRISAVDNPSGCAVWNAWSGDCSVKPIRENLRYCGTPDLDYRTQGVSSSLGEINWVRSTAKDTLICLGRPRRDQKKIRSDGYPRTAR